MMSLKKKIKADIKTSQLLLPILIFWSIYLLLKLIFNTILLDFLTSVIPGYHISDDISNWLLITCSVILSVVILVIIKLIGSLKNPVELDNLED